MENIENTNLIPPSPNIDIKTLSPFTRFCCTIGNIPASYLVAMSYEEQLLWLCNFLENTVIPTINNNGEAVTELQKLFIQFTNDLSNQQENFEINITKLFEELKSFVNNYFDNLDVQTEINNKLNEMQEDGTLQEIISQYLNSKAIFGFDNVNELKEATNLIDGSYAKTLGYYNKNDNGSALYKIRNITNDDVVDDMFIIPLNKDNLIAELIFNDIILPEQVGCYGNGVNDDTTKFKKLIEYLENNNLNLYGNGIYLLNDNININNINVYLENAKFIINNTLSITATNKTLKLPSIINETLSNKIAINLINCYSCDILVNYIENFETGLQLTGENQKGCVYNLITIKEIRNCLNSLKLQCTNSGWVNENTFIKGRLFNETDFINLHGSNIVLISLLGTPQQFRCNNNYFLNTCVEGNEGNLNGLKIKLEYATFNHFENLRYEGTNPKIYVQNSSENVINGGYNINSLIFTNEELSINYNNESLKTKTAGRLKGFYQDITPTSNSYPMFIFRNTNGQIISKINNSNYQIIKPVTQKILYELNQNGINGYNEIDDTNFLLLRSVGKNIVIPGCDGINHTLCISKTNSAQGCFLWIYDNHLYGKMSQPANETDGTIIL